MDLVVIATPGARRKSTARKDLVHRDTHLHPQWPGPAATKTEMRMMIMRRIQNKRPSLRDAYCARCNTNSNRSKKQKATKPGGGKLGSRQEALSAHSLPKEPAHPARGRFSVFGLQGFRLLGSIGRLAESTTSGPGLVLKSSAKQRESSVGTPAGHLKIKSPSGPAFGLVRTRCR